MRNQVLSKIRKLWPNTDPQEILALLDQYGTERWEIGRTRVQLAILKLSGGDRERLPELVKMAKRDWRDALAYAEYPEEMKTNPIEMRKKTTGEAEAIRQRDRQQYEDWLKE